MRRHSTAVFWVALCGLALAAIAIVFGALGYANSRSAASPTPPPSLPPLPPAPAPEFPPMPVVDLAGTYCGDDNVCTQDLYYNTSSFQFCENRPRPNNTVCVTECHVAGATSGRCRVKDASCQLGDYSECRGYCPPTGPPGTIVWSNSSCSALFPRNLFFFNGTDTLSETRAGHSCLADQCVRFMLGPSLFVSQYFPISVSFGNEMVDCMELIDPALATLSCIRATSHTFESDEYDAFMNNEIFGDPLFPADWPARLCTFRYGCGRWNQTMLNDPTYTDAAAAAASVASWTTASDAAMAAANNAVSGDMALSYDPALPSAIVRSVLAVNIAELSEDFIREHRDTLRAHVIARGFNVSK